VDLWGSGFISLRIVVGLLLRKQGLQTYHFIEKKER
jgi:hypothetical protein